MALIISVNGIPASGLLNASITTSNYFSSDTFSLSFAIGNAPLADLATWSQLSNAYVEVAYAGTLYPTGVDLIAGNVDSLVADPILNIMSIEGRDLSAALVDTYLQQDFVNQTASEIVETIAGQHGLEAQVTPTLGNIGRYFGDGYTKLSLGQFSGVRSHWDLVVQLAREQNFDVFVQGNTLSFQPTASVLDPVVQITPRDVTTLRVERRLAIQPSATVVVQSWNSQNMAAYSSTTPDPEQASSLISDIQSQHSYLFSKSNLTSLQADLLASRYTAEISRLRTVLHLEMPWSFFFSARSLISLLGTNSAFDGLYQVDCVERHYDPISGSSQTIRAVPWPIQA